MFFDQLDEQLKSLEPDIKTIKAFWENSRLEDEFQKLKLQLRTEDIMYEAIAIVMVTTGLRIDEVLQLKNTTFPPSNLMSNEKALNYDYIPKGERSTGKKVSCIFPFETWHYISTVIFKLRKQRKYVRRNDLSSPLR